MKNYIVTGGSGFIGSALVDRLLELGHKVIVIDDFRAGKIGNLRTNHPNLTIYDFDISDWNNWLKFEHDPSTIIDGIFHLAAEARIQPSITNPNETIQVNVAGTYHVLEFMNQVGIKKIVYSASSSSYGLKNKPPLVETMEPDCLNPYAASKYMGEILCKTWGKCYSIKNVCLKYFNVYGPRSPVTLGAYSPVIGLFFKQALEGKPITVVGDGLQTRDFTYVYDVVNANIQAMNLIDTADGFTLNIGTNKSISIIELAQKIQKITDTGVEIQHIPARPAEAFETCADISLAKKTMDWEPQYDLDSTLIALHDYYKPLFKKAA